MPERSEAAPRQVDEDSRGILDPGTLRRRVNLERFPPPPELSGLIATLWAVTWSFPPHVWYEPQVLVHPCVNLTVAPPDARRDPDDAARGRVRATVTGVQRELSVRRLVGSGWSIAAMSTPGGFGAWTDDVRALTDTERPVAEVVGAAGDGVLLEPVVAAADTAARAAILGRVLVDTMRPERADTAREVARVAGIAEQRPGLTRAEELADEAATSLRSLQRLFDSYAGISPAWMIRRYRLLEVAESVRDGATVDWAELAIRLGYSDQAHLIRDFRSATGRTPQAYADEQRGSDRR